MDASDFDPKSGIGINTSSNDDLANWVQQLDDPALHHLMITDPDKAKEIMIQRGIQPPPDASSYTDPDAPPSTQGSSAWDPIRTNPDGTIAGNITSPVRSAAPVVQPGAPPTPRTPADPVVSNSVPQPPSVPSNKGPSGGALDPEDDAIPEKATSTEGKGKPGKDSGDLGGALGDFGKSLQGVKALQPPPVNPVGTPAAPHPNSVTPMNLQSILASIGQAQQARQLATLGRLLVAGKA